MIFRIGAKGIDSIKVGSVVKFGKIIAFCKVVESGKVAEFGVGENKFVESRVQIEWLEFGDKVAWTNGANLTLSNVGGFGRTNSDKSSELKWEEVNLKGKISS